MSNFFSYKVTNWVRGRGGRGPFDLPFVLPFVLPLVLPFVNASNCISMVMKLMPYVGNGYLANLPAGEFTQLCEGHLPAVMTGADFLLGFGEPYDQDTQVAIVTALSC